MKEQQFCEGSIIEYSVVKLKDGREGTVLHIYPDGKSAIIELKGDPEGQLIDIEAEDIKEILWKLS